MSGEGPESIPTSADPRSHRPTKKRALTPLSAQAASVDALFAKPDQEIRVPAGSDALARPNRAAPPEIVTNVQGSSAGAGSGEFHVYKASRRREYERLREMDDQLRREKDQEQFNKDKSERDRRDEERTRKNREKREKLKARKANKGKGGSAAAATANNAKSTGKSSTGADQPTESSSRDGPQGQGAGSTASDNNNAQSESSAPAQVPGIVIHDDDD